MINFHKIDFIFIIKFHGYIYIQKYIIDKILHLKPKALNFDIFGEVFILVSQPENKK